MNNERVEDFVTAYVLMYNSKRQKNLSGRKYKEYYANIDSVTALLREITAQGDFAEAWAVIKASMQHDLEYLADTPEIRANIQKNLDNLLRGEVHYHTLRDQPKIYRKHLAPGFIARDCLRGGSLPKDGMHKALASHRQHIVSRQSSWLETVERDFIAAQLELSTALGDKYAKLQGSVLRVEV